MKLMFISKGLLSFLFLLKIATSFAQQPCTTTFGNVEVNFTDDSSFSPNFILGVRFYLSEPGSLTSLHLNGRGTNSGVRMGIYSDNNNAPSQLIAQTELGTVTFGEISLATDPTPLTEGYYWIMAIYSTQGYHTYTLTEANSLVYYKNLSFGDDLPQTSDGFLNYNGRDYHYWATIEKPQGTSIDTQSACGSFTWMDGETYTESTNTPTYVLPGMAENGCDSVITLHLTIHPQPEVSLVYEWGPIHAMVNTPVTYQWNICENDDLLPILLENEDFYYPISNGHYSVTVTTPEGCQETSECLDWFQISTEKVADASTFMAYPNPSNSGEFTIQFPHVIQFAKITLTDVNGKIVFSKSVTGIDQEKIICEAESGLYIITIETLEWTRSTKWMID